MACVPGEQGSIAVMSLSSRTKLATLTAEGHISGATFGACERDLMTVNNEGTVHVWYTNFMFQATYVYNLFQGLTNKQM